MKESEIGACKAQAAFSHEDELDCESTSWMYHRKKEIEKNLNEDQLALKNCQQDCSWWRREWMTTLEQLDWYCMTIGIEDARRRQDNGSLNKVSFDYFDISIIFLLARYTRVEKMTWVTMRRDHKKRPWEAIQALFIYWFAYFIHYCRTLINWSDDREGPNMPFSAVPNLVVWDCRVA